jgi:heat shock protein HspQ
LAEKRKTAQGRTGHVVEEDINTDVKAVTSECKVDSSDAGEGLSKPEVNFRVP